VVFHSAGDGAGQQFPAGRKERGERGDYSRCLLVVEVYDESGGMEHFGPRNLGPVKNLHVLAGIEKGKDLDAQGSENNIGVAGTAQSEATEQGGEGEGRESPPPRDTGFPQCERKLVCEKIEKNDGE